MWRPIRQRPTPHPAVPLAQWWTHRKVEGYMIALKNLMEARVSTDSPSSQQP
jgi:hypothetical protein